MEEGKYREGPNEINDVRRDPPRTPRVVDAPARVDQEALERIRREELDEQWRRGGQYD
jgi:hypothetical protein